MGKATRIGTSIFFGDKVADVIVGTGGGGDVGGAKGLGNGYLPIEVVVGGFGDACECVGGLDDVADFIVVGKGGMCEWIDRFYPSIAIVVYIGGGVIFTIGGGGNIADFIVDCGFGKCGAVDVFNYLGTTIIAIDIIENR